MDAGCIVSLLIVFTVKGTAAQNIQISPSPRAESYIGSNLILTCSNTGIGSFFSISWFRAMKEIGTVLFQNNVCSEYGQLRNETLFMVKCGDVKTVSLTVKNTQLQQHGEVWNCVQTINSTPYPSNITTVFVKVRVSSVNLTTPSSSTVTIFENSPLNFSCTTSLSRPAPTISWYLDGGTSTIDDDTLISSVVSQSPAAGSEDYVATTGSLTYRPSKDANGKYVFCKTLGDDQYTVLSNRKILLNVSYKPVSGPLIQRYNNSMMYYAINNKEQSLTCTVIGGNPLATLSWSCFKGNEENLSSGQNVSTRWIWRSPSNGTCKCIATHLGVDEAVVLNVRILSPPTTPLFMLHSKTVQGTTTVKILRDSNTKPIICLVSSNPSPDRYTWRFDGQSSALSQESSLNPSKITFDGRYWCQVTNTMTPTQGSVEYGNSSTYINIQRLYAPVVKQLNDQPIVEGSTLSVECKSTPGKPTNTTYTWMRKFNSSSGNDWQTIPQSSVNGGLLVKQNINRNDAGIYRCTAWNVMKPTAEKQETGSSSETFVLNVLYKTSISSFIEVNHPNAQEVTVTENSTINLHCKVYSNPGSTIEIEKDGLTKASEQSTKDISYSHPKVTCDTAGIYQCVGFNEHNKETTKPYKNLTLFVTCSPRLRLRPQEDFRSNITSALNEEARLKISLIAYPVPKQSDYTWWKRNGETWIEIKSDDNIKINTSGLESSLVFHSVLESDYQKYRVNVSSNLKPFHQEFFLNPYGKPKAPENVKVVDESVKQSSAVISWNPGFNGGPEQTFTVLYKKTEASTWLFVTKDDDKTRSMNVTLIGLADRTKYEFQMYSRNILGNSTITELDTFTTIEKTSEKPGPAALIGGAIGGSVAVIILIAVIVVLLRRSAFNKGKSKNANDGCDRKRVYEDDDDDDGMQDNPMYDSAGPQNAGAYSSRGAVEYSTVNKAAKAVDIVNDNEYAVVSKPKQAKTKPVKKEKSKQGFFKDKKGKKMAQEGDIYENSPANEMKVVTKKDETIYEDTESSTPKKNVNKDGLIYADLTFNHQPKGQRKLVIHGLDSMTEYVEVDFTKRADPLPDSDDENIPAKN